MSCHSLMRANAKDCFMDKNSTSNFPLTQFNLCLKIFSDKKKNPFQLKHTSVHH